MQFKCLCRANCKAASCRVNTGVIIKNMGNNKSLLMLILLAMMCMSAWSKPFNIIGKIIHVNDGDTVVILDGGQSQIKIRMSSIDAPESAHTNHEKGRIGQPYAENSGRYLATLIKGKQVEANCFENDRYGRAVCDIRLDGRSINAEMIKSGWAWANNSSGGRYLRDKSLLSSEAQARSNRVGLWAGIEPIPPWEWRDKCWQQHVCPQ